MKIFLTFLTLISLIISSCEPNEDHKEPDDEYTQSDFSLNGIYGQWKINESGTRQYMIDQGLTQQDPNLESSLDLLFEHLAQTILHISVSEFAIADENETVRVDMQYDSESTREFIFNGQLENLDLVITFFLYDNGLRFEIEGGSDDMDNYIWKKVE